MEQIVDTINELKLLKKTPHSKKLLLYNITSKLKDLKEENTFEKAL
ncbi:TPA: hypothetical protein QCU60_004631 [Bacillus cereus]|nr:hypothetical protein [Bacillus cereus]